MGVGAPPDFFVAVERGIDLFDCVLPTRVARTGQVWTGDGRLNLRNARHQDDDGPIDAACACEACRNHSRAYLAHLFRAHELLGYRLATSTTSRGRWICFASSARPCPTAPSRT